MGRLMLRVPGWVRRVIRYGCVGGLVSLWYSLGVVFFMWALAPVSPVAASIAAFALTMPASFFAHRGVSFADRPRDRFQAPRFAVSTAASFVVAVGGMYWITAIGGHHYLFGIAWNWMVIPAMNFAAYMVWVFRSGSNSAEGNPKRQFPGQRNPGVTGAVP